MRLRELMRQHCWLKRRGRPISKKTEWELPATWSFYRRSLLKLIRKWTLKISGCNWTGIWSNCLSLWNGFQKPSRRYGVVSFALFAVLIHNPGWLVCYSFQWRAVEIRPQSKEPPNVSCYLRKLPQLGRPTNLIDHTFIPFLQASDRVIKVSIVTWEGITRKLYFTL